MNYCDQSSSIGYTDGPCTL